jgi:hypothetical protein
MTTTITSQQLAPSERNAHVHNLFGLHFPLLIEPRVYAFTDLLVDAYEGGQWEFYLLSNGGFFMSPNLSEPIEVKCPNFYSGHLSAAALGIVVGLYAYSHVSFSKDERLRELGTQHYFLLRDYALQHPEARQIFQAVD